MRDGAASIDARYDIGMDAESTRWLQCTTVIGTPPGMVSSVVTSM